MRYAVWTVGLMTALVDDLTRIMLRGIPATLLWGLTAWGAWALLA